MKASIIRIGNSRGIRIPKSLLEQCRLSGTVELEVCNGRLQIRPASTARSGWEESFRRMAQEGDDALLDREALRETRWEKSEWVW